MKNENNSIPTNQYPILKEINKFHLSKSKIRPNFYPHDSVSYKSECALGNKSRIKYRRPSEIKRDIQKQNEKIVDQIEQQKKNLTQNIIRQQFNKESNNFAPPIDFSAFILNELNGDQKNKQLDKRTYNVFEKQQEKVYQQGKQSDNETIRTQTNNEVETCVQLPFLKKRFNTPPISQTRQTMRQIQSKNLNENEYIVDRFAKEFKQPYNLASQYNIVSLHNILQSQNDLNITQIPTANKFNEAIVSISNLDTTSVLQSAPSLKSTHRAKRAVSEQGFKPYKKQVNCFPEDEFYMYLKEVSQTREKNYLLENSINKLLSTLKDESASEPKKVKSKIEEVFQIRRESNLVRKQKKSRYTQLNNQLNYLYIHEQMDIPKHKMNHLGADRAKIAQVLFNRNGILRKNLSEEDFLAVIYPKDFVRSEEEKRNAPSAESNFDLNTYFDFMYFNSRLQEYITKKNTKTLGSLEADIISQSEQIEKKREAIIKDHEQKAVNKFRIRGQSQDIHSQILKSEDNHSSFKDYNIKRQQYLMDYTNLIEKKLGNMDLITQLTRTTYNQITDVIKQVKKKSGVE